MQRSETIAALAAAMAKCQAQIKGAARDLTNSYFKSKYADLTSVWEAIRPAMSANDLALIQFPIANEHGVGVESIVTHKSGEWMCHEFVLPMAKEDAQGGGSCITYCRRYAAAAIFSVCPEDDDGNAAVDAQKARAEHEAKAKANGDQTLADKTMTLLGKIMPQGTAALQQAWGTLSKEARQAVVACCGEQWDRMKAEAAKKGGA